MFRSWIARVFQMSAKSSRRSRRPARRLPARSFRPSLEALEARSLLSVTPVSIASTGSTMGNAPSSTIQGAVSANGQYDVFSSSATDLVSGKTINALSTNVYRRDLIHGTTSLVSVDSAGNAGVPAGYTANVAAITADGRYIAFVSDATDLIDNGTTGGVFVRDMTQGKTYQVSTSYQPYDVSKGPSIGEGNGQLAIAFTAYDGNSPLQVYVSTLQLNSSTGDIQSSTLKTTLVSADSSGKDGNWDSSAPVLSTDGSTLMFNSQATNLKVPGGYFDGQPTTASSNGGANLFLYSLSSQTLKLLSAEPTTGTNATGNEGSSLAVENIASADPPVSAHTVSSNGQYVVFTSGSDNLVAGVTLTPGSGGNVYWRDLKAGKTQMVSISTTGTGFGGNLAPSLALTPDGRYVAFYTLPRYGVMGLA